MCPVCGVPQVATAGGISWTKRFRSYAIGNWCKDGHAGNDQTRIVKAFKVPPCMDDLFWPR